MNLALIESNSAQLSDTKEVMVTDPNKQTPEAGPSKKKITFLQMIDFRVLMNYVSLFFVIFSFFAFFGYFCFILFLPGVLKDKGIVDYDSALLLSLAGIGDLIGRPAAGFLADLNVIAKYKVKAIANLLCAIDILMFVFADTYIWLGIHSFFYGVFGGAYVCMMFPVLVEFVGLGNAPKNLAVTLFIQGIGACIGQPIMGMTLFILHTNFKVMHKN